MGQHPNSNRGSATVNFALGTVENNCEDSSDFILFHGTLMLIAWMILAPLGIYYVRYPYNNPIPPCVARCPAQNVSLLISTPVKHFNRNICCTCCVHSFLIWWAQLSILMPPHSLCFYPMTVFQQHPLRYRKGENVEWAGREWYEMHEVRSSGCGSCCR